MEAISKEHFVWEKQFVILALKINATVMLFKLEYSISNGAPWLVSRSYGLSALVRRK